MGDPPRLRNKYSRPKRLWDMDRLEEEKGLKKTYGLKNMREIWIALAVLKKYRREARRLLSITEEERKSDAEKILARMNRMGILGKDTKLDDILSLHAKDILERRLQTLVLRKGMAHTVQQSRQLITHGYIQINDRRVSAPGYMVEKGEEESIRYARAITLKTPPRKETQEAAKEGKEEAGETAGPTPLVKEGNKTG